MTDQYEAWRRALAGDRSQALDLNKPWPGFYRTRNKDRDGNVSYDAVALWREGEQLVCIIDGREVDETSALEAWRWCQPITHEVYVAVTERGEQWPDVHDAVVGHNAAPVEDTMEAIAERIERLTIEAEALIAKGDAKSKNEADRASDLANTLAELEAKCGELHKAEKAPHMEAGRAVDRKWFPLRDSAADLKTRIKRIVLTPFLARAEQEKRAAAAAAIAAGKPPAEIGPVNATAGSIKRSTGLRTATLARVTDWPKLLSHLAEHPEIRETAQRIANASAKAGVQLPGTEIVKERVAA